MSAKGGGAAGTLAAAGIVAPQAMHVSEVSLAALVLLMAWLVTANVRAG